MDENYKEALRRAWSIREDGYKNKEVQEVVEYIFPQLKQEKKEKVEPITDGLSTEFQKQVSYLIASSINKEHEYSEGYVKWVSQSLLEYAKKENVKESDEDEKIRNEILEYFTITRGRDFVANPERQKWISYIERQKKESRKLSSDYSILSQKEAENIMVEHMSSHRFQEIKEEQKSTAKVNGELIPTENQSVDISLSEWSEEDERMLSRCIKSVESSKNFAESQTFKEAKDKEKDWLKSLPERFNLQPKQEWSEEDRDRVIQYLHDKDGGMLWSKATEITNDILDILRPQPKNEWSEEDENRFNNLCRIIRQAEGWNEVSKNAFIKWLNKKLLS